MKKSIAAIAFALGLGAVQHSDAAITFTFEQVGSDVTMTVSGSLDLTGLIESDATNQFGDEFRMVINTGGTRDRIEMGAGSNVNTNIFTGFTKVGSPFGIGTGTATGVSSTYNSSASAIYIEGDNERMFLPDSLNPGDTLTITSATTTFQNKNLFTDLGLTAGTTTLWLQNQDVGVTGTDGDIYVTVIPEPSIAALFGFGALLCLRRRRS